MDEDQRKSPRRSLDVKVNFAFDAIAHTAQSKDISKGGICLITDKPLEEGKMLSLRFTIPGSDEPVDLHGKVMWSRPSGEYHHENGMSFWRVDSDTEQKLVEYLQESPL